MGIGKHFNKLYIVLLSIMFTVGHLSTAHASTAKYTILDQTITLSKATEKLLAPIVDSKVNILTDASNYAVTQALVEAMVTEQSEDRLRYLAMELKPHQETYLNFMIAVLEEAEKNPKVKISIEKSLEHLASDLDKFKPKKSELGKRSLPTLSIFVGTVGLLYGMWTGYLDHHQLSILSEHKAFLSASMIGMVATAGFGDVLVAIKTLKSYKKRMMEKKEAQIALSDLQKVLFNLSQTEFSENSLQELKNLQDAIRQLSRENRIELAASKLQTEFLRLQEIGIPTGLDVFLNSKEFRNEIGKFKSSLSAEEKAFLTSEDKYGFSKMKLSSIAKLRLFENRIQNRLTEWLNSGGDRSSLIYQLTAEKNKSFEKAVSFGRQSLGARVSRGTLALSVTTIGLFISLGHDSLPIDAIFNDDIVQFLRGQTELVMKSMRIAVISTLSFQVAESIYFSVRKSRATSQHYVSTQGFDFFLDQVGKASNQKNLVFDKELPGLVSANDLIQKLKFEILEETKACSLVF